MNELVVTERVSIDISKGLIELLEGATGEDVIATSEWMGGYIKNGLILYGDLYNEARRLGIVENGKETEWLKKFARDSGYQAKAIRNAGSVMEHFNPHLSRRRDRLKYSHYDALASLPEDKLDEYIDRCVDEGWTQKETRKQVKQAKRESIEENTEAPEPDVVDRGAEPGWHKIGNQCLYCGSNTDSEFIDALPSCAFAFADPPYNAGVDDWDEGFTWEQDYLTDVADVVAVTPGGWNAYGFYRETEMPYQWEAACWVKNGMTHGKLGYANWIKVSIFAKDPPQMSQDIIEVTIKTSETGETSHKGRKPYPLLIHLIDTFSSKGDTIVDPFAGSGQTLLVSESMERVSYNAEIDPWFCASIIERAKAKGMRYERR